MPPVHENWGGVPRELRDAVSAELLRKAIGRLVNLGGAFWACDGQIDPSSIISGQVPGEIMEAANNPKSNWHVVKPLANSSCNKPGFRKYHNRSYSPVGRGGARRKLA